MKLNPVFCLFALSLAVANISPVNAAEEWRKIGHGEKGTLYIHEKSTQTMGDGLTVRYRLDFPEPQQNRKGGKEYLSMVVDATLFCAARTILRTELTAYSQREAKGEVVGGYKSSVLTEKPVPIVAGGSDEDIWRFVCKKPIVAPQKK